MQQQSEKPAETAVAVRPELSVWNRIAERHGMDRKLCRDVILNTVMPRREGKLLGTEADMAAALLIADRYKLDMFTKEIHFTPGKGGGILSIVGIDGWVTLANREASYKGWEYADVEDANGNLIAVDVWIHFRGDRIPQRTREWLKECQRPTEPWRNQPRRMLRNRALCQAIRCAFGVGGIMLPDEAADMIEAESTTVSSRPLATPAGLAQRVKARAVELEVAPQDGTAEPAAHDPLVITPEESARLEREAVAAEERS